MPCRRAATVALAVLAGALLPAIAVAAPSPQGLYRLTATGYAPPYAPTFTGNGLLGVRVPPDGQGYAPGTVAAQSELAGFYAQPPGLVQQRANIPTWSTLTFSDGGTPFDVATGHVSNWRQTIDLHTGIISTSLTWAAPDGHVTNLSYEVLTSRANANLGLVQLTLTPQWTGTATVTDAIDGTPATMSTQTSKGWNAGADSDWLSVQTQGTGITAALASTLQGGAGVTGTPVAVDQTTAQSVGQQVTFPVHVGTAYTLTKYVAISDSQLTGNPLQAAQSASSAARGRGWDALVSANNAAWAKLWQGRIDVLGDRNLGTIVNASQFYLWSSTRAGVNWSISPAGLSSNGYDGHIFWDAETWMYPTLLAMHPDLAVGMDNYRYDRLTAAEQHARATGWKGARFPWESALDGTEQIPPPVSVNSEGLYEQHITADVALAQWQYYLATGNRGWLAHRGWPVLSQAAAFWASRATRGAHGTYHITHVTGPDEENPNVNDEVFTNTGAKRTLQFAVLAAHVLGRSAPAKWTTIANHLVVGVDHALDVHPEFSGYRRQLVKQADVTLLQYPWGVAMPLALARNDINFYVPRSDPGGPSMTDAISQIDTSALQTPGCSSYVYTQRSWQPFIKDPFFQFSETRTGGAFTFMTGIGGFLQEFLYGYSGLRFGPGGVAIDPSLVSELPGIALRGLRWRGRVFDIVITRGTTTVTVRQGRPLALLLPVGGRTVRRGHPLRLRTPRPDLIASHDPLQCQATSATSAAAGAPALAAVDGSPATDWQPVTLPASLTVRVRANAHKLGGVTVRWGQQWPAAPAPNVPPPPGPVTVLRPTAYTVAVSGDGHTWSTVATVGPRSGVIDRISFAPVRARYVRVSITAASGSTLPELDALTAG